MKIIHTSDLHLDSPLTTRLDSKKVRERKSELLLSFKRMAQRASGLGASAFIIAGDLFDSESAGVRTVKSFISIVGAYPDITFFYLPGNHEGDIIKKYSDQLPPNFKIFGSDWTYFKLGEVNIIGKSDTAPAMFEKIELSDDQTNIVVLHGELRDRCDNGGVIGRLDAENLAIDYIALGHYHSYRQVGIGKRCTAVYSGTPEGRGFDEVGDCGFVLIDTDGTRVSHSFIKNAMRTLRIIECDVTDIMCGADLLCKIEALLLDVPRSDLVRIKLIGTREITRSLDLDHIAARLGSSCYYLEIKDDTRVKISPEQFKNDLSLKGEFIRGVLADGTLSDKEKERVLKIGLGVLLGEEEI